MLRWGSAQPWVMVRLWLRAGFRLLRGSVSRCCDSDQVKLRYLGVLSNEDYCLSEVGVLGKERGSHWTRAGNGRLEILFATTVDRGCQWKNWRRGQAHSAAWLGILSECPEIQLYGIIVRGYVLFVLPPVCVWSAYLLSSLGIPLPDVEEDLIRGEHNTNCLQWDLQRPSTKWLLTTGPFVRCVEAPQGPVQLISACPHSLLSFLHSCFKRHLIRCSLWLKGAALGLITASACVLVTSECWQQCPLYGPARAGGHLMQSLEFLFLGWSKRIAQGTSAKCYCPIIRWELSKKIVFGFYIIY